MNCPINRMRPTNEATTTADAGLLAILGFIFSALLFVKGGET
jgi:hypothetical protein